MTMRPELADWQMLQVQALSNTAEEQKKCSSGVVDGNKHKESIPKFRTGEMNILQAQRRSLLAVLAFLHRHQAKH